MNFVNAELAKLAVNTFVTTKISYANMLGDVCGRLEGADVDVVTEAIGSDSRIGGKYLRGAVGYGGPCFPRDNVAFATLARGLGARADLAESTDAINDYQVDRVFDAIVARQSVPGAIGVLGLSYKPDTAVVEESQGLLLVERLVRSGYDVLAYDPKAMATARQATRARFEAMTSAESCVRAAALVVIMTPWPEFANIAITAFSRPDKRLTVIDCWRIAAGPMEAAADLVYLGRGAADTIPLTV
jgi:UDPglucose 6-dehydrogenase